MEFKIQEPNHELTEGYFILIIKISVLISFAWMIGLLIIYTYPCITWDGNKYPPTLLFLDKYHVLSLICTVVALYFYTRRIAKKYKNRLITNFLFDEEKQQLSLELLNIYTGKTTTEIIDYKNLNIAYENKNDKLYGSQRIFHFLHDSKPISTLNIDRCAWRKHPEIDALILKLKQFNLNY